MPNLEMNKVMDRIFMLSTSVDDRFTRISDEIAEEREQRQALLFQLKSHKEEILAHSATLSLLEERAFRDHAASEGKLDMVQDRAAGQDQMLSITSDLSSINAKNKTQSAVACTGSEQDEQDLEGDRTLEEEEEVQNSENERQSSRQSPKPLRVVSFNPEDAHAKYLHDLEDPSPKSNGIKGIVNKLFRPIRRRKIWRWLDAAIEHARHPSRLTNTTVMKATGDELVQRGKMRDAVIQAIHGHHDADDLHGDDMQMTHSHTWSEQGEALKTLQGFLLELSVFHEVLVFSPSLVLIELDDAQQEDSLERVLISRLTLDKYSLWAKIAAALVFPIVLQKVYMGFWGMGYFWLLLGIEIFVISVALANISKSSSQWLAHTFRPLFFTLYFDWIRSRIPCMELNCFHVWTMNSDYSVKLLVVFSYVTLLAKMLVGSVFSDHSTVALAVSAYAASEIYIKGLNYLLAPPDDVKAVVKAELQNFQSSGQSSSQSGTVEISRQHSIAGLRHDVLFKMFYCNDATLTLTSYEMEELVHIVFQMKQPKSCSLRHIQHIYISDSNLLVSGTDLSS